MRADQSKATSVRADEFVVACRDNDRLRSVGRVVSAGDAQNLCLARIHRVLRNTAESSSERDQTKADADADAALLTV